jgi:hypothetical protein
LTIPHTTLAITLDVYSHAIPALQQDAATVVADLIPESALLEQA